MIVSRKVAIFYNRIPTHWRLTGVLFKFLLLHPPLSRYLTAVFVIYKKNLKDKLQYWKWLSEKYSCFSHFHILNKFLPFFEANKIVCLTQILKTTTLKKKLYLENLYFTFISCFTNKHICSRYHITIF